MNRISAKMKLLSLAVLGLGGMALAGSAAAACPTSPVPPWSSQTATSGSLNITDGGLDGSACRLDAAITGNTGFASAFVTDDSPSNEARYRAQFLVNVDALAGMNVSQVVRVFAAATDAPSMSVPDVVTITVFGNVAGTSKTLGISTACASGGNGRCSTTIPLTATGMQRVEIDWTKGATGGLKVWLNKNDEGAPNVNLTADNSAWGGVDHAYLGLASVSPGFRAAQLNKSVGFDSFDSRRSTFIGF